MQIPRHGKLTGVLGEGVQPKYLTIGSYPCDLEIAVRHSLRMRNLEQPFLVFLATESKSSLLKASLLDEAEQTGDLQLICKVRLLTLVDTPGLE